MLTVDAVLQWQAGLYHGLGCETFAKGSIYHGNFYKGRRHGFGVCQYHNGDYYEGEWVRGVRQGLGAKPGCITSVLTLQQHLSLLVLSFPVGTGEQFGSSSDQVICLLV